jgi:hypothetical protein
MAGSGAGVFFWIALGAALEAAGLDVDSPSGLFAAIIPAVIGGAFGTPFGIAQWLVLRRRLGRASRWIFAAILGYALVFLAGTSLFPGGNAVTLGFAGQVLLGLGLGAAVSLPSGLLQWWLVLRGQVAQAGWWVVASLLSWAIGFALSFALRAFLGGLFFIIGVAVALALTGLAMVWLLRRPSPVVLPE